MVAEAREQKAVAAREEEEKKAVAAEQIATKKMMLETRLQAEAAQRLMVDTMHMQVQYTPCTHCTMQVQVQ
jgi:hypothetical protein